MNGRAWPPWRWPFHSGWPRCAHRRAARYAQLEHNLHAAEHHAPEGIGPDGPMEAAVNPAATPPELLGEQPVNIFIRRALDENRMVQAAHYNVMALKARDPPGHGPR